MSEDKSEVAKVNNTDLRNYEGYEQFAGVGFENQTVDDYAIPFINILQSKSPQVEESPGTFHAGMVFNTVTGEIKPGGEGILFVPAYSKHEFVEWKPREQGGGLVAVHAPESDIVRVAKEQSVEYGKFETSAKNSLVETYSVFGVILTDAGEYEGAAVIAFTSTKISKYRKWMTMARQIQITKQDGTRYPAPLFSHRYRLKTVLEKRPKGTSFNWDISFDGTNALAARIAPNSLAFQEAFKLYELIASGEVSANYASQVPEAEDDASADAGTGQATKGRPKF